MHAARTSPSRNSASATRAASSAEAPPAVSSRKRSSRCCESSSTTSASRVGSSLTGARRRRTSSAQRFERVASVAVWSGMLVSRHAANGFDEGFPRPLLLCEHAPAFGGELVEPAPALIRLLHPGALDPLPLLQAIEQWIERIDVEGELPVRPGVNELAQLVAVARSEERRVGKE